MPMFRKKPVVIEARQMPKLSREVMDFYKGFFTVQLDQPPPTAAKLSSDQIAAWELKDLEEWCGGNVTRDALGPCIEINTLEGAMLARPGDWIIKGVKGEFYPCKPEIFAATYEAA